MSRSANSSTLRALPSVDRVLRELGDVDLPRPILLNVIRRELNAARAVARQGTAQPVGILNSIRKAIEDLRRWQWWDETVRRFDAAPRPQISALFAGLIATEFPSRRRPPPSKK